MLVDLKRLSENFIQESQNHPEGIITAMLEGSSVADTSTRYILGTICDLAEMECK